MSDVQREWRIVHIEDEESIATDLREYLEGEEFPFGRVRVLSTTSFEEADRYLAERKVDVLVLDVFRGTPSGGDAAGVRVLDAWRVGAFSPVVFYTALPDSVEDRRGPFVHVVAKDARGLQNLRSAVEALFATNMPQIHRAIVEHVDRGLGGYVWGFATQHWSDLEALARGPDFLRLLLGRIGLQLTRDAGSVVQAVFGDEGGADLPPSHVHPVEYYVRPPLGTDRQLGDLMRVDSAGGEETLVVLWPSCDLVSGRIKVEQVLCAPVKRLDTLPEYTNWQGSRSNSARRTLRSLMSNNYKDRYHFLPAAWELPHAVVDFGEVRAVAVETLHGLTPIATVASPFAESIAARFVRYAGRLGTPDLDVDALLDSLAVGADSGSRT